MSHNATNSLALCNGMELVFHCFSLFKCGFRSSQEEEYNTRQAVIPDGSRSNARSILQGSQPEVLKVFSNNPPETWEGSQYGLTTLYLKPGYDFSSSNKTAGLHNQGNLTYRTWLSD